MKKLTTYNGSVELMSGIVGSGDYPLIEAHAVQTREDGTRLDEEFEEIKGLIAGGGSGNLFTAEVVNGVCVLKLTKTE